MSGAKQGLKCKLAHSTSHVSTLTISIPSTYVDTILDHAACIQKNYISVPGFQKGAAPIAYIKQHYKGILCEHTQEFLLKYFVINQLYKKLHMEKMCIADQPRIKHITIEPHEDAQFEFELSIAPHIDLKPWKHFPFKAPKRKKYKDIDKQVELFIKEEQKAEKECADKTASIGDWVCFEVALIDEEKHPLLDEHKETLWVKIGDEEADASCRNIFLDKKVGDTFYAKSQCLQEYFSEKLNAQHLFRVDIKDVVPYAFFSLEDFKHHFRLKNQKDLHLKLIEVFSYRNDLSQRRSTVEEAFKLLLSKHHVQAPNHLILRQQKRVLEDVQDNPDYHVYKTEKRFKDYVRLLAAKQVKEQLIIDQISMQEKVSISHKDVRSYLNFTKRARMKEFMYFLPPASKRNGHEVPISHMLIKECCMREKTINHVIYHLTKR